MLPSSIAPKATVPLSFQNKQAPANNITPEATWTSKYLIAALLARCVPLANIKNTDVMAVASHHINSVIKSPACNAAIAAPAYARPAVCSIGLRSCQP